MKFNELNLTSDLMRGIEDADFTDCTPVQERTFKLVLEEGRDATVQSQTGTGKTAAFLISIFEIFERASRDPENPRRHAALVVVPTRELAVQVADEAKLLGRHLSYRIGSVFGGVGYGQQERLLEKGADIIIGTPGRLLDFSSSGKLDFKAFDFLVLDEADRMLDMGFLPDVRRILKALPPAGQRRTLLFSATLATRVKNLAWEHMNNPGEIEVAPEHVTVDEITQELYHVTRSDKLKLLLGLLDREKPDNALIFTNMKRTAVELARRLSHNGLPSEYIMGDLPQRKRLDLIKGVKEGRIKLLVATDVAARGLHIDDLDLVVNYDIPEDYELYVHRIGRTARAGKSGKAITLACERYVYGLEAIESFIGQKIPVVWPEEGLFKEDASAGMRFSDRQTRNGPPRRSGSRSNGKAVAGASNRSRQGDARRNGGAKGGEARKSREPAPTAGALAGGEARANNRNRPRKRPASNRGASAPTTSKPSGNATLEDRLSYYREKYGEDFQINKAKSDEGGNSRSGSSGQKRGPGRGAATNRTNKKTEGRPRGTGGEQGGAHQPRHNDSRQSGKNGQPNQKRGGTKPRQAGRSEASSGSRAGESPVSPPPSGLVGKLKRLFKRP